MGCLSFEAHIFRKMMGAYRPRIFFFYQSSLKGKRVARWYYIFKGINIGLCKINAPQLLSSFPNRKYQDQVIQKCALVTFQLGTGHKSRSIKINKGQTELDLPWTEFNQSKISKNISVTDRRTDWPTDGLMDGHISIDFN